MANRMRSFRNCDELSKIIGPSLELCENHVGHFKGEYVFKKPENKDVDGLLHVLGDYALYVQSLPDFAPYKTMVLFIDEAHVYCFIFVELFMFKDIEKSGEI